MFEKLDSCPSCGHPKFLNHLISTDQLVSGESFALVKCSSCDLVFTNPRPSVDSIARYYDSAAYHSHHNSFTLTGIAYSIAKFFTLRWKHSLIKKHNSGIGSLLDYGCGTGDFLKHTKNNGWQIAGLEVDSDARHLAEQKTGIQVGSSISELSGVYDVITLWHVLEHIHDLKETLSGLVKLISKDGILVIALPNLDSFDSKFYQDKWAGLDVPRHLYHFTPDSFRSLVAQFKLKIVTTIPMKLDAYYVSVLSEKNLTSGSLVNGIKTGLKSNQKAALTGQFSSLIYILRK